VISKTPVASDQLVSLGNYTSSCDSSVEKNRRTKKYLMQGIKIFCLIGGIKKLKKKKNMPHPLFKPRSVHFSQTL
jgi:hypothetical protein